MRNKKSLTGSDCANTDSRSWVIKNPSFYLTPTSLALTRHACAYGIKVTLFAFNRIKSHPAMFAHSSRGRILTPPPSVGQTAALDGVSGIPSGCIQLPVTQGCRRKLLNPWPLSCSPPGCLVACSAPLVTRASPGRACQGPRFMPSTCIA